MLTFCRNVWKTVCVWRALPRSAAQRETGQRQNSISWLFLNRNLMLRHVLLLNVCGSREPSPECEEDTIAVEVHEKVIGSNKWRIGPQRPWRSRWSLLLRKRISLWHFTGMHLTACAPLPPVPEVYERHPLSPPTVGFLKKGPVVPSHSSAPSTRLSTSCRCPLGALRLPQMWPELRSTVRSDASSITRT